MYLSQSQRERLAALRDRAMHEVGYGEPNEFVGDVAQELDNILGPRASKIDQLNEPAGIQMTVQLLRIRAASQNVDLFEAMGWDEGGRARGLPGDESISLTFKQALALKLIDPNDLPLPAPPPRLSYKCVICEDHGCWRCQPAVFRSATNQETMYAAMAPNGHDSEIMDELERYGVPIEAREHHRCD